MHYLLILSAAPDAWADLRPSQDDGVYDDWVLYTKALHEAGVLVDGSALESVASATTVRVRDGRRLVTDGPYTDAKEHLIGYYVIDVSDLDTALSWAAKVPSVRIGSVEVRPLQPGSDTATVLAS